MNTRRSFLASAAAGCLCASLPARSQAGKVRRIGYLNPGASGPDRSQAALTAFHSAMRELGYIDGRDYTFDQKFAQGKNERFPELAAELVASRVDLIIAPGGSAARAAKRATATIPIVFVVVSDPVKLGLISSLGRPGGNATGRTTITSELDAKRIEMLREVAPGISSVSVLMTSSAPAHADSLAQVEAAAQRYGMRVFASRVRNVEDVDGALAQIASQRPGALIVLDQAVVISAAPRIVEFARRTRVPAVYQSSGWVDEGGLMSYGASYADDHRRAASYVDKIFKGAKPADLPVEQPTTFELVINRKTANALGLTIPQSILLRTDRMIE